PLLQRGLNCLADGPLRANDQRPLAEHHHELGNDDATRVERPAESAFRIDEARADKASDRARKWRRRDACVRRAEIAQQDNQRERHLEAKGRQQSDDEKGADGSIAIRIPRASVIGQQQPVNDPDHQYGENDTPIPKYRQCGAEIKYGRQRDGIGEADVVRQDLMDEILQRGDEIDEGNAGDGVVIDASQSVHRRPSLPKDPTRQRTVSGWDSQCDSLGIPQRHTLKFALAQCQRGCTPGRETCLSLAAGSAGSAGPHLAARQRSPALLDSPSWVAAVAAARWLAHRSRDTPNYPPERSPWQIPAGSSRCSRIPAAS